MKASGDGVFTASRDRDADRRGEIVVAVAGAGHASALAAAGVMRDVVLVVIAGHVDAAGQHGVIRWLVRVCAAAGADVSVHIVKPTLAHEQGAVKQRVGLLLLALRQLQASQVSRDGKDVIGLILSLLRMEVKAPRVLAYRGLCIGLLVFIQPDHNAAFNIRHCPVHVGKLFGRCYDHGVEGLEIDNDGAA